MCGVREKLDCFGESKTRVLSRVLVGKEFQKNRAKARARSVEIGDVAPVSSYFGSTIAFEVKSCPGLTYRHQYLATLWVAKPLAKL